MTVLVPKKYNVFLDLDNTIICSEKYSNQMMRNVVKYAMYDFVPPFVTVARPHLQFFLDWLFENCNVHIWTAASNNYASFIYENFIRKYDSRRVCGFIFHSVHCNYSYNKTGITKCLNLIFSDWKLPGFTPENTLLIDDLKELQAVQPKNCLRIKPFRITGNDNDNELLGFPEKIVSHFNNVSQTHTNVFTKKI